MILSISDEFVCENFDASYALKWCGGPEGSETALVTRWATGLEGAATRCPAPSRRLLMQHCRWAQPALLRLPREYDRLFTVSTFDILFLLFIKFE